MVFVFLLPGCTKTGNSGRKADADAGSGNGADFVFVCPVVEDEYWKDCIRGIKRADKELGTTTRVTGPETADNFTREITGYMEKAVASHPDGIMAYAGTEDMFPLVNKAAAEGIPVLTVDSDAPGTDRVAYLGTDLYGSGYKAGETIVSLAGGKAKIGYICSSFSAQDETEVYNAFKDAIHDYDMEIVSEKEGHEDPGYAAKAAKKMLKEHPEITAIFCTAGYNITGAARAKEELGLDSLVLVGFDDVKENLEFVRKGTINALLAQSPEQMGYKSVCLMKEYIDKGGLAAKTYNTGTILITQENVDTYSTADPASEGSGKTVRVGYYSGDNNFQNGFTDEERKSGYAYEYYMAIAALTGWKYKYIYGSRTESIERLEAGEVDIVAGVYQTGAEDKAFFSKYDMGMEGEPRYFAVNPERHDLLVDLDRAMEHMQAEDPDFTGELRQKYYNQANGKQALSEYETEWLARTGTLHIGYVRHNLPLSDQGEDGSPAGLVSRLFDTFSDYLHVNIQPVCYENIILMEEGLQKGEIDAAFPIYSDVWLNESKGFVQTDAFISERAMLVYQGDYDSSILDSVGLSNTGIGQRYYLSEYYPEAHIQYYDTRKDIFQAIQNGGVKCIIGCSSILQRFLATHKEYKDMNIAYLDTSENFGMAVKQGDSILAGILNKSIRQMDAATINNAILYYSNAGIEYTFKDFIQKYSIVLISVLVFFFAVLLWVFYSYRRKVTIFNAEQAETQARLETALNEAKVASEAKTTFLSSMSHDIRTPMNAIVGMTTVASGHLDDRERVKDCLEKISLSSHHLLTLINDVLDISKIESGKLTLNPVNFSLRDMTAALVSIVRPQVQAKKLQFDIHIHNIDHEIVYADEVRFNQIIINILTNAVKYTPDGGRVVVDLTQETLPGGKDVRIIYTVADNGIGMSKEFMVNMYDIFSRATDNRINKIQGTGLGLSIVKRMVEMMHGTIDCQSKEGEGTTFTITVEFPVGDEGAEKQVLPGIKVLLADDDEVFLESAKDTLLEMEALPETAHGGTAALEMVTARHKTGNDYDVIIVDWKMPDMNGLETVKAIRSAIDGKIPIILASAYDWSDIENDARDCGINGFINKPLFRSYIYEKMHEVLYNKKQQEDRDNKLGSSFKGMHLLVAEDNELNWEVIDELLGMYGITADNAANGQICADMLSGAPEGTYDMVLMDVQMPVMNGKEAARAIRASKIPYVKNIPVIAMTADAFAEDIAECIAAGMDEHVSKPVDMDKLFQAMHKVLSKHS